jgi:hypothetical protein
MALWRIRETSVRRQSPTTMTCPTIGTLNRTSTRYFSLEECTKSPPLSPVTDRRVPRRKFCEPFTTLPDRILRALCTLSPFPIITINFGDDFRFKSTKTATGNASSHPYSLPDCSIDPKACTRPNDNYYQSRALDGAFLVHCDTISAGGNELLIKGAEISALVMAFLLTPRTLA